jgi:hypothetical protein
MEMTKEQVEQWRGKGNPGDWAFALADSWLRLRARIEELEAELAVSIERDKLWQQAEAKVAELEREHLTNRTSGKPSPPIRATVVTSVERSPE